MMLVQAVGVFTVAAVLRTPRWLHVRGAPWLGAERAQEGGGVRRPRADFDVVRLQQRATLRSPILLKPEDDLLERKHLGQAVSGVAKFPMLLDAGVATKRWEGLPLGTPRQKERRRDDQQRQRDHERVTKTDVRRDALPASNGAFEHAAREPGQTRDFHAMMIDDGGE